MIRLARATWLAAGAIALAGVAAFFVAYRPGSASGAGRQALAYAGDALSSGLVIAAAAVFAVAAALALIARRRPSPAAMPQRTLEPATTIDVVSADVVREILAELRAQLRGVAGAPQPDIISFVDVMLKGAVRCAASDVHLHPLEAGTGVSFRVQGVLHDVMQFPREHHRQLVARIKVMARLTTFQSDRPQDGHFVLEVASKPADFRVSVLPTNHGERVVVRVANVGLALPDLGILGMPADLLERYRVALTRPQGIVFVTGPTGAGKTTTIYASLAHVKRSRGETTQIATIEDPIEFDVPFLTQTQVRPDVGLSFAAGLRSILRQDPNVIMVGEIRDAETAHIAVQAGLTGHQIVSTVHAESAAGVFNRLIEMGVEPFLLASASTASLAQRLVRTLCPSCKTPAPPSPDERARLVAHGLGGDAFFTAPGCATCDGTGYLGRTAFFELLEVTATTRELVNGKVPTSRIHEAAVAAGMAPLVAAGVARAREGVTSLREVLRVCG